MTAISSFTAGRESASPRYCREHRRRRASWLLDNKARFLEAAECLLQKLLRFADPSVSQKAVKNEGERLRKDLDSHQPCGAFGMRCARSRRGCLVRRLFRMRKAT